MSQKIYLTLLIMLLCINISGCGKPENPDSITSSETSSNPSSTTDNDNSNVAENTTTDAPPEETASPESTGTPEPEQTPAPEPEEPPKPAKKPKTETAKLSSKQQYSDENKVVKVLGLKEYKKIEGDDFTDNAGKKKKYLVLFLSITNNTSEEDYINYNYVSAKVDGKKVEHTFLMNQPKSYPTIFTYVPAGGTIGGFIVWKVPEEWKKFEFVYDGWEGRDNISLKAKFTPDDLSDPLIYNANNL